MYQLKVSPKSVKNILFNVIRRDFLCNCYTTRVSPSILLRHIKLRDFLCICSTTRVSPSVLLHNIKLYVTRKRATQLYSAMDRANGKSPQLYECSLFIAQTERVRCFKSFNITSNKQKKATISNRQLVRSLAFFFSIYRPNRKSIMFFVLNRSNITSNNNVSFLFVLLRSSTRTPRFYGRPVPVTLSA